MGSFVQLGACWGSEPIQFPGNSPVPVLSLWCGHVASVEEKDRLEPSVQHAPRKLSGEIPQLGKFSRKKKDGDGTQWGWWCAAPHAN